MISIIVAEAEGGVIGSKNDLPWYLPADLKRFRELTTGHTVIMGRNTFESIVKRLGKPLPDRRSIVISSTLKPQEGFEVASSLDQAIQMAEGEDEVFVIGGTQLYREAINKADKMYITEVQADIPGDTHFPTINTDEWDCHFGELQPADDKNQYAYRYDIWTRR